ncbi:MAG: hypothetical protein JNL60_06840 [Bacteroidia bacterium]|nr:hypothetical protein [Bacteroidia bacterium]
MKNNQDQLEALQDIRQMMKQSSRFLSLSGFSGVMAGVYALTGAYFGNSLIQEYKANHVYDGYTSTYMAMLFKCTLICTAILVASIATALLLSKRRANKKGYNLFDHTAIRMIINMAIPLGAGGVFCLALIVKGETALEFVAPSMLIFYGLSLINGSKYTLNDIRYLGLLEVILGLVSCFYLNHGILFWALGFGVLHIVYGSIMWFKYERGSNA